MSTLFVSSARTTAVNLDALPDDVLHVTQSGSITTFDTAVKGDPGSEVVVDGSIRSEDHAIEFWGAGCAITVGSTGTVRGGTNGIVLGDNTNVVINNGQISASLTNDITAAILLDGSDNRIFNNGILSGYYGINGTVDAINGSLDHIANIGRIEATDTGIFLLGVSSLVPAVSSPDTPYGVFNSGTIVAGVAGVYVEASGDVTNSGLIQAGSFGVAFASGDSFLSNTGTIVAQTAVFGSYDRDILLNQGTIQGDILLNEGDDIYDGRTGTVTDIVNLGKGDDVAYGGSGVETLVGGTGRDSLFGHGGDDSLVGGIGQDYLDGGAGIDQMAGGTDDDIYVVDDLIDVVVEAIDEGTDLIRASISYALGTNLENLWLTGSANLNGTGNALANRITGNAGSNLLDGGIGADNLAGGAGNDIYVVDDRNDVVTEAADEGTDAVRASVSHTLGANVENLLLTGADDIDGTGNDLANSIVGNGGSNHLDGGAGADVLAGGEGSDTYTVDHDGDLVTEQAGEGTDTVSASVAYALGAHVENLVLTGSGNISGIGNERANEITGNAGSNLLDGGAGADRLAGGLGNDTYIVDDASDIVTEGLDEGTDAVRASISYALADNVENLVLTGAGDSNGTGNNLANIIAGNGGSNRLEGGGGDDQFDGGAGQDTALFSGLLSDYTITRSPDGTLTVLDNMGDARDGTDTLKNIEFLQFQDGTITVPTRAPVAPAVQGSVNPINENAAPFTPVATVQSPGLVAGSVAYSITSNPGSKFVIDPASGVISLVGAVDYESTEDPDLQTEMVGTLVRKFYVLSVKATETLTGWSSAATPVKIYVSDVNEAPTGFSFTDGSTKAAISEAASDGTAVGTLQAGDPEGDAGLVYAFDTTGANGTSGAGNAGGRFKIESGQLKVAALTDITKAETYTITLKVTDRNGGPGAVSTYKDFQITVNPGEGNTPPSAPGYDNSAIALLSENGGPVATVVTVHAGDSEGDPIEYELVGNPGNLFSIDPDTGVISFVGGANYEAASIGLQTENAGTPDEKKYFNVAVRARESRDNGQVSGNTTVKVYLNDVNEAQTGANYTVNAVSKDAQAGTTVATLQSVIDPDTKFAFRTYSYSLVNADGSTYTGNEFLVDAGGNVKVGASGLRDVSGPTVVPVFVKITDQSNAAFTVTKQIDLTINPVNHGPTDITLTNKSVRELSAAGDFVGRLGAADQDAGETFTYQLIDTAGGRFKIVNGHDLVVDNGFLLDFEQAATHRIKVQVTDSAGASFVKDMAVGLIDWSTEFTAGSNANDVFYGGAGNDSLSGGLNHDHLVGGAGVDTLKGDGGNDTIGGGAGRDKLYGSTSATNGLKDTDIFLFDTNLKSKKAEANKHKDIVYGFEHKKDAIWLDGDVFKTSVFTKLDKRGNDVKAQKVSAANVAFDSAKDGNDYIIIKKIGSKKAQILFDADGAGRKAAVEVATINYEPNSKKMGGALDHTDFFII
jgi:Ca2+-binding RTX toxin-like protein